MSEDQKINRRQFFTEVAQVSGALVIGSTLITNSALAERKRGSAPAAGSGDSATSWPMVEPGKDAAVAMAYHHTHEEAEKDKNTSKVEKTGVKWNDQRCKNCSFYADAGKKKVKIGSSEKEVSVGKCTIFPNKLVAAEGICNSWAKKA